MRQGNQSALPLDEWHEDDGDVLWWKFPIEEPPYVGTPNDEDWPGYHTHWTYFDWRRDDAMEGRIGEEEARLNDEAAAEITRLRAALAAIKECDTRWRTGTLSSNEAMIEIAASIRARG